ncbi:MAG: flagellar export chaperone FlgN [Eubacteriales bacterium]|nr:flagellar export chaperone FlgN [Eubacteriales bacterium]
MTHTNDFKRILNEFYEYLVDIYNVYKDLIPILQEELTAIEKGNIELLNNSMKAQQSLLLKTKSFDSTLDRYLSSLGFSVEKLSDMLSLLPEDEMLRFSQLLGRFSQTMTEVSFYKEKCSSMLQSKLYTIDRVLETQAGPKDNITYDRRAEEIQTSLFSKTFEKKI